MIIDELSTMNDSPDSIPNKINESMQKPEINSNLDERTRAIISELVNILEKSSKDMRPVVVDGGLGIELFVADRDKQNGLFRNHGDLDIRPMEDDIGYWKETLREMGFIIDDNIPNVDSSKAFTATMPDTGKGNEFRIDVWGLKIEDDKRVSSSETGTKVYYDQNWEDLVNKVEWKGMQTFVIKPEIILANKLEYSQKKKMPLRKGDLIDYAQAGISVPKIEN